MKIYNEDKLSSEKQPETCLIELNMNEARLLIEMIEVASNTHKKRSRYKKFLDRLEALLHCY